MTDQPQGARIVTMQQFVLDADVTNMALGMGLGDEGFDLLMKQERTRAEASLSQAFADGYEIADVTVSVGERVIATVWTLRPAEKVVVVPFELEFGVPLSSEFLTKGVDVMTDAYRDRADLNARTPTHDE